MAIIVLVSPSGFGLAPACGGLFEARARNWRKFNSASWIHGCHQVDEQQRLGSSGFLTENQLCRLASLSDEDPSTRERPLQ
ncbi:hypothetical protein ASPSYDRAFT_39693 [Aspergillus sydowii CBS 593.65]|uniref:Uncharacterized protein n=1 Tax=Aspergillus sydowii CBS 593.65 TaxID=1036612 RepID=A0A1L9TZN3_9EURO|nr:uncharacterized protein ASPSYDRAFT_39693 [Aspergillus sydowii CBS 593.65]OJJ64910.1 hypothetical protein ASPSYDRAFT_39693 [Aspergillus sydowii CBS 593.65]